MTDLGTPTDLTWGAFSRSAPWVPRSLVDLLARRNEVLRAETRAEIPSLTEPSRVPPGARVVRVVGRLAVALAPWYTRKKLGRFRADGASTADISRRLRIAAIDLGSTYIKLGQIISSGEGLFPESLVNEFKLCRDRVPPEPWDEVRAVVEAEFGGPLHEKFAWFDREPHRGGLDRPGASRLAS
ncbi:MAG: hypothetical protein R2715_19555 [Ilumatobacteraceae bacterium]